MTTTYDHDPSRAARARARRVVVTMLSLLALALGMFVMTSMSTAHAHDSVAASSAGTHSGGHQFEVHPVAGPLAGVGSEQAALSSTPAQQCDSVCELSCALAGAACVLVVIAVAVSLLAIHRGLALLDVAQRGAPVVLFSAARTLVQAPSLLALSISRT